jgi:Cu-Zn family superoxide dismutase
LAHLAPPVGLHVIFWLGPFGSANSIIGRAVIVHEKADDLRTQPTGDAGGRVAGGVIGLVNP